MRKNICYMLILSAAIMWGTLGVFTKNLTAIGFSTTELLFVRGLITFLVCFLIYFPKHKEKLKLNKISDIKYFFGTGILSYLFFNMCYMNSIIETGMSVAAILLYTAPAIVMIISVFIFNDKITKNKIIIVLFTFIGCCMVTGLGKGENISFKGIIFGLCSGFGYALYSIFGKCAMEKEYSSAAVTTYTFLFVTIGIIPFVNIPNLIVRIYENNVVLDFILSSIITGVLPYMAYTKGLYGVKAANASITASLEPVVASILGILIFSEPISLFKIIGICLVMGSVFATAKN